MARRETCNGNSVPVVRLALEKDRCVRKPAEKVSTSDDVIMLVKKHYACKVQEFFLAIQLDIRSNVVGIHEVSIGALDQTMVDPRVLFAGLLTAGAAAFIIVHNHPSGDPEPSDPDVQLTRQIKEGARILGIRLLDHVVIARGGQHVSFQARGML